MICSVKTRHFTGFGQTQMLSFSVYSCMHVFIYLPVCFLFLYLSFLYLISISVFLLFYVSICLLFFSFSSVIFVFIYLLSFSELA